MSNTHKGGRPPGDGSARRKRGKRRPGRNKTNGRGAPGAVEARSGAESPSAQASQSVVADERGETARGSRPASPARPESAKPESEPGEPVSRRRKRRRRNKQAQNGAAAREKNDGGQTASTIAADSGESARADADTPSSAGRRPGKFRPAKGGARKPGGRPGEDNPAQRYLRAPVKPSPKASFDPAVAAQRDSAIRAQPRKRGGQRSGRRVFAALDLGTNNCRLLVAAPDAPGRFRVVDAFSRIVRLGEGLAATGRLNDDAMRRAIEALHVCAGKLSGHPLAGQRLIATEACRRAENGEEFLANVRSVTGLELEIIDRQTEARLAAEGCGVLMDRQAEGAVLFDIGGGSTELVLVRRSAASARISGQIVGWTSLPVGVVTLSERHGGGREVTPSGFEAMIGEVCALLEGFEQREGLSDIWGKGRTHLLGTSGTVTTIAGVHLGLPRYDRRKVDGIWLEDTQIDRVLADLLAMDFEGRARNPCIGRDRADLVLAGCAILEAIRRVWPSQRLRVADRGLREGMLNDLMHDAGVWGDGRYPGRQRNNGQHSPGAVR